jgi:uncharacterized protein DUF1707
VGPGETHYIHGMAEDRQLRASDAQREQVAQEIREHFAAGRLTEEELDERVEAAYSARTVDELQTVRSDLPSLPATPAQQKAELAERRSHLQRRVLQEAGGGIGLFVLCTAIWAASGAAGSFWPVWVLLIPLLVIVRNGWRLYGPSPELDRVEQELDKRSRREHADRRSEARIDRRLERRAERHDRRRERPDE